jgi:hypothetical protein
MHTVFVPVRSIKKADPNDLLNWNDNAYSSWGVSSYYGKQRRTKLEPPLSGICSKTIETGEQLVFCREFDGLTTHKHYIEMNQKFVHVSDIHFVPERQTWCNIDDRGDLADMARICRVEPTANFRGGTALLMNRRLLDEYTVLTNSMLVRMFDFTYVESTEFSGWRSNRKETTVNGNGLIYRHSAQDDASYVRGVQIIAQTLKRSDMKKKYDLGARASAKQYATYIAQDWKNDVISEISCDPAFLSNYFTKSEKPFEITPAYFRPEVLLKYKADPEKYTVGTRSITCRGAWHLETYDINEAGQVHTYLIYLSHLPFEEQIYWKSFNESPKAPISNRAFTTDIKGEFSSDADPLDELKGLLGRLGDPAVPWWKLRSGDLLKQLNYPVTNSSEEWATEVGTLDKALVEGLEEKWLRKKVIDLGCPRDDRHRSLKLLEECLVGLGFEIEHAHSLVKPLHDVHNLRSQIKSHATGDAARKIRSEVLSAFGSYRGHFGVICQQCLESLVIIDRAFRLQSGSP